MHVGAIYIIEPTSGLEEFLRDRTVTSFSGILRERTVIHSDEGGRTGWGPADFILRVKLVFLCSLLEYDTLSTLEKLKEILGQSTIDEALFDQWWTITRLEYTDDRITMEQVSSKNIGKLSPTNNDLVNSWIVEKGNEQST